MPGPAHHRHPGDGWVTCGDHRHWGLHGAAGLFLVRHDVSASGEVTDVVLQHRATWSHEGGTWGIPGGAVHPTESPEAGALREAAEEAGIDPAGVLVVGEHVLDHGVWTYTTVVGHVADGVELVPAATDHESIEVAWVPVPALAELPLHPAFAEAVPRLLAIASRG
ncbi:NUDIX hydrolase [Isoptericola sp. JC619]|uniref:NUDIX hydrolase n=1 Tax=Isoptericola sediminis TaxID=2733572 RepID=A0A849K9P2_9MICO|nr:NUDIX hydrolase [Isoptericola sediminis]NNU27947.1 NUDIX hydrolase [Isoptericola sediminis]